MKKILIACCASLLFSLSVFAQHDAQISQHLLSRTHYNPAAAGARYTVTLQVLLVNSMWALQEHRKLAC